MINRMYAALPMRAQTENTTFSCKDDCTLRKHTRGWTYSALWYFLVFFFFSFLRLSNHWLTIIFEQNSAKCGQIGSHTAKQGQTGLNWVKWGLMGPNEAKWGQTGPKRSQQGLMGQKRSNRAKSGQIRHNRIHSHTKSSMNIYGQT